MWLLITSSLPSNTRGAEPAPPAVSSFSPASGPAGTLVQILGTNLESVSAVKFNGVSAAFSNLAGKLTAIVPAGATTGPISLTTPNGVATSAENFTVTQLSGPSITSFSPASGKAGASVQVRGANLVGVTSVKFNGVSATFTVFSGIVFATVPAAATTGPITVTTAAGSVTTTDSFTVEQTAPPAITGFSPMTGEPGTSVQIEGANLAGVTEVKFGQVPAPFSLFGGLLLATVPTNAVTGPITVVTAAGSATSTASFTVTTRGAPAIAGFSPTTGEAGVSVEIWGTNLIGVTSVQFNGVAAAFTNLASGLVFTTVPTNATTGPITVATPLGTNASNQPFLVINPLAPEIGSFSPESAAPGELINIHGTNLVGVTSVKFNGVEAEFLEFQPTRLLAFVPTNATTGPVTVTARTGTATSSTAFTIKGSIEPVTPPSLSIKAQGQDQLEISWPATAAAFVLQDADALAQSAVWTKVELPAVRVEERFVVTVRLSAPQKFFRLAKP